MNKNKIIAGMGLAVGAAALLVGVAGAQTTTFAPLQKPVVEIGATGKVLLRGTIVSVSSGAITMNSWGGVWTVNVPASVNKDVTKFKPGDFVGVQGSAATDASWTVNATDVRDWTQGAVAGVTNRGTGEVGSKNFVGTAGGVSGSSFTLSAANGTSYTVNVASTAKILNRNRVAITLANVQSGNSVRVYGTNSSGIITAEIVRDMTLPMKTTTSSTTAR